MEERTELQQLILSQSWISPIKFRRIATDLCKLWIDKHWNSADMAAEDRRALQEYIDSRLLDDVGLFYDGHGKALWSQGFSQISIGGRVYPHGSRKIVVEVLCYPLKLFVAPRSRSKLDFFYFLRSFMSTYHTSDRRLPYPRAALREALIGVVLDDDEDWFLALFPLAFRGGVDIPQDQLIHKICAAAYGGRKWKIMKLICDGVGSYLPNNFLESTLAPALVQAIRDGDNGAYDLQQWIEHEGWTNIQFHEDWSIW